MSFRIEKGQLPEDYKPTISIGPDNGTIVGLDLNPVDMPGISRYRGKVRLWSEAEYVVKLVSPAYEGLEEYVVLIAGEGNDSSE